MKIKNLSKVETVAHRWNFGLVPDELEAVPLDPFDGRPFRYDAKRRIVYSVGKNLVDDGGSSLRLEGSASDPESRRRWNAEDAVYRIEAASGK